MIRRPIGYGVRICVTAMTAMLHCKSLNAKWTMQNMNKIVQCNDYFACRRGAE